MIFTSSMLSKHLAAASLYHDKSPLPERRPKPLAKSSTQTDDGEGKNIIACLLPYVKHKEYKMKELTSYNRVAGYLNKIYDLLNKEYFESTLSRPTITIQSTPKAYGHFSLRDDTWVSKLGGTHEINIGAGTLARPIENVVATLLHEMVHYYNYEQGIQDCSRGNTYHNRKFKDAATQRDLCVEHHEKYGWSITSPSEKLLDFVIDNELTDILINRNESYYGGIRIIGTGTHSGSDFTVTKKTSSTRKYICPCCGNSVRATKAVNIACLDCSEQMVLG